MKEAKNQILVADKIFITPEFKRKKKIYKWHFILSVFLVVYLFSYYIYAEYDKNKSEEVSQTLLAEVNFEENKDEEVPTTIKTKDNLIIVILDPNEDLAANAEEINIDDVSQTIDTTVTTNTGDSKTIYNLAANTGVDYSTVYTAKDGTDYKTVAIIDIPKIGVHYPVIAPVDKDLLDYTAILKISPCKYYGPDANEVGNYCIVGHNYHNSKFFSKVPDNMDIGDSLQITDSKGRMLKYIVYDKYIVDPDNQDCTDQNTKGKREVTIITCTYDSKQRVILKCVEESSYNG